MPRPYSNEEKRPLQNDMWPIRYPYSKDPSAKVTSNGLQSQTQDLNAVKSLEKNKKNIEFGNNLLSMI